MLDAVRTAVHGEMADLYPGLLAAVLSAAMRVSIWRWHVQDGATSLTALAGEALDALAAGLPAPTPGP